MNTYSIWKCRRRSGYVCERLKILLAGVCFLALNSSVLTGRMLTKELPLEISQLIVDAVAVDGRIILSRNIDYGNRAQFEWLEMDEDGKWQRADTLNLRDEAPEFNTEYTYNLQKGPDFLLLASRNGWDLGLIRHDDPERKVEHIDVIQAFLDAGAEPYTITIKEVLLVGEELMIIYDENAPVLERRKTLQLAWLRRKDDGGSFELRNIDPERAQIVLFGTALVPNNDPGRPAVVVWQTYVEGVDPDTGSPSDGTRYLIYRFNGEDWEFEAERFIPVISRSSSHLVSDSTGEGFIAVFNHPSYDGFFLNREAGNWSQPERLQPSLLNGELLPAAPGFLFLDRDIVRHTEQDGWTFREAPGLHAISPFSNRLIVDDHYIHAIRETGIPYGIVTWQRGSLEPVANPWFIGEADTQGWQWLPTLGWVRPQDLLYGDNNWVYRRNGDWMYARGRDPKDLWVMDLSFGWMHLSETHLPPTTENSDASTFGWSPHLEGFFYLDRTHPSGKRLYAYPFDLWIQSLTAPNEFPDDIFTTTLGDDDGPVITLFRPAPAGYQAGVDMRETQEIEGETVTIIANGGARLDPYQSFSSVRLLSVQFDTVSIYLKGNIVEILSMEELWNTYETEFPSRVESILFFQTQDTGIYRQTFYFNSGRVQPVEQGSF